MVDWLPFQDVVAVIVSDTSSLILSCLLILEAGPTSQYIPLLKLAKVYFCCLQPKNSARSRDELWGSWLSSARLGPSSLT